MLALRTAECVIETGTFSEGLQNFKKCHVCCHKPATCASTGDELSLYTPAALLKDHFHWCSPIWSSKYPPSNFPANISLLYGAQIPRTSLPPHFDLANKKEKRHENTFTKKDGEGKVKALRLLNLSSALN